MSKTENKEIFNPENLSFKYGVAGGLTISTILLLFQLNGNDFAPMLKLSALVLFGIIIINLLNRFKSLVKGEIFIRGIGLGTKTSLIAAITVIGVNLLLFLINNDISFSKYSVTPDVFSNFVLISGILLFEIFVFGSLISFITLQYLKSSSEQ